MENQTDIDKWSNSSRKRKKSFQALLKPEEVEAVAKAKKKLGETTDRGVLLALCQALERRDKELLNGEIRSS